MIHVISFDSRFSIVVIAVKPELVCNTAKTCYCLTLLVIPLPL